MIYWGEILDPAEIILNSSFVDYNGNLVRLSDVNSNILVVYFYPRAMTSGCTREANAFNELLDEFRKCGAEVFGVSTDPPERNRKFAEKYGLRFILLSDVDGKISESLGILKKGTKRPSTRRVTYILKRGQVVKVLKDVRPAEKHAYLALEEVKRLC